MGLKTLLASGFLVEMISLKDSSDKFRCRALLWRVVFTEQCLT